MTNTLEEDMQLATDGPAPSDQAALAKMIELIMTKGATFRDAFQVSDEQMKALYARGYELQRQQKYQQAQQVFEYLCYLNHFDEAYWIALGFCREQQKQHQKAVQAYVMAGALDVDNPVPPLRCAECLMRMDRLAEARSAAEMAIRVAGDDPRYARRRERAEFLLKAIDKRRQKRRG